MMPSSDTPSDVPKHRHKTRLLALPLLVLGFGMQYFSQTTLQGDWAFLIFLTSEWFLLMALILFIHRKLRGGGGGPSVLFPIKPQPTMA